MMALIEIGKRFEEKNNSLIFRDFSIKFIVFLLLSLFLSFGQGSTYLAEWVSGTGRDWSYEEYLKYDRVHKIIPFVVLPSALLIFLAYKQIFITEVYIDILTKKLTKGKTELRPEMIKGFEAENLGGYYYLHAILEKGNLLIYSGKDEEEAEKVYQRIEEIYGTKVTRIDE